MDALGLTWRDLVFGAVGLGVLYVVVMLVRLLRVGRKPARAEHPDERRAPSLGEAAESDGAPAVSPTVAAPAPAEVTTQAPDVFGTNRLSRRLSREPAAREGDVGQDFAAELARSNLEVEVQQMRRETHNLRQQVAALEQEMLQLRARANVSPLYSEAMTLAQRGVPADGIAGQCGISLGEAELVAALARGESTATRNPQEEENGDHPGPGRRTGTHG